MRFSIDFNYGCNDALLEQLGAKEIYYGECCQYEIEIDSFESLKMLLQDLDKLTNDMYSAVISFDPPTIYLDNKV